MVSNSSNKIYQTREWEQPYSTALYTYSANLSECRGFSVALLVSMDGDSLAENPRFPQGKLVALVVHEVHEIKILRGNY